MKSLRFWLFAAIGCLAIPATSAWASVMTSALSFNGIEDEWQDNSVSFAVDSNTNFIVDTGDLVAGIVRMTKSNSDPAIGDISPPKGELDVIFAFRVTSATAVGGFSPSVYFTLVGDDALLKALLPSFAANISAGDMAVILTDALPNVGDVTQMDVATAFATLNADYALEATVGLSAPNSYGDADYLEAILFEQSGKVDGKITLAGYPVNGFEYAATSSATIIGQETGGGTFGSYGVGGSAEWIGVLRDHLGVGGVTSTHDITFDSALYAPSAKQLTNGWIFSDDSRFRMNPVPEPASLLVWSGLLGIGIVLVRCRRVAAA
ncbi:MAG: hypothetical protein ACYC3X_27950 [Pirellulaceae bacterium]